ncbi:S8 family serine peptidase [Rhodohalobacter mucosus]|uniref:Peptidase S8 n=1 Tax=Rhodohalobacter mucosus TaxID=2079485 RepID=A0A316TZA0_9BACT|nr:S8 family serine peptidase [Rhodohalobacter mucosus]PWN05366.1 peptidase S8 [Rhodohalobacter mucosus]
MNKLVCKLGFAALIIAMISISCDTVTQPAMEEQVQTEPVAGEVIDGQYIVVLNPDEAELDSRGKAYAENFRLAVMNEAGISDDLIMSSYSTVFVGFSAKLDESQLNRLKLDPRVDYIEEDKIVTLAPPCGTPNGGPCEPDDGGGDSGDGGGSTVITPWGIDRVGGSVTYTGSAVSWVIDTGIQLDHPDLNVDGSRGFTAFNSGPDSKSADDRNGHGTHVAGTIGAQNSILGVASGVVQVPVKVLDRRGSGSVSGVIAGVDYVAANANPGDVANMSLGGGTSQSLDDAVIAAADAGVLFSIAAGNSGTWASGSSPARVDHPNTWTIAATDVNDTFASFSNYGPPTSFAAPGVNVESTWTGSSYRTISGTSMAAPHVAGILIVTGGTVNSNGTSSTAPNGVSYPIASHQ